MGRGAARDDQPAARSRGKRGHDAESVHDACRVIDTGPLSLEDLPTELREDEDLRDNLEQRFGLQEIETLRFRLVEIPLADLEEFRLEAQIEDYFAEMVTADEEWTAAFEADEIPDHDFQDGEARRDITRSYLERFRRGAEVTPIVVDLFALEGRADILDGYHRLAAAHEAGAQYLRGYELLPAEK